MEFLINITAILILAQCLITNTTGATQIEVIADESYHSNLPIVPGAKSCGGAGRLIGFHVEGCTKDVPCSYHLDKNIISELLFIPSQGATGIGIRLTVNSNGNKYPIYNKNIDNSEVEEGVRTLLRVTTKEIKLPFLLKILLGSTLEIEYSVHRNDDYKTMETCVQAQIKTH